MLKQKNRIFHCLKKGTNSQLNLAYSTILLNFSLCLLWEEFDEEFGLDLVAALIQFLKENVDLESAYRASVALGCLLWKSTLLIETAKVLEIPFSVLKGDNRMDSVSQELRDLVK